MIRVDDKNFGNKVNQPAEGVCSDPNLDEFWWDPLPETAESTPFYPVMGAPVAACSVYDMSLAPLAELLAEGRGLIARFGDRARDILEALCSVVENYGKVCVTETPAPTPEICIAAAPEAGCAPILPAEEPAPPAPLTEEEKSAKGPAAESGSVRSVPVVDLSGSGSYFPPNTGGSSTSNTGSPENTAATAYEEFAGPLARTVQEEFLDMQYRNERAAMKQFFDSIMKKLYGSSGRIRRDYG